MIAERTERLLARPMAITKLNWFSKYKVHTRHVEKFGMPYFLAEGCNVFDQFSAPKFHLVQFSDGQAPQEDPTNRLDPRLAEWVDSAVVPLYPHVTELFGPDTPFTLLLRPDNYIATIWPGLDVTPALQWLANIITSPHPELEPHRAANAWLLRPKASYAATCT